MVWPWPHRLEPRATKPTRYRCQVVRISTASLILRSQTRLPSTSDAGSSWSGRWRIINGSGFRPLSSTSLPPRAASASVTGLDPVGAVAAPAAGRDADRCYVLAGAGLVAVILTSPSVADRAGEGAGHTDRPSRTQRQRRDPDPVGRRLARHRGQPVLPRSGPRSPRSGSGDARAWSPTTATTAVPPSSNSWPRCSTRPGPRSGAELRQVGVAFRLDEQFSKARILGLYLDAAYFGDGAYGVTAAALHYFGRAPESAVLGPGQPSGRAGAGAERVRPSRSSQPGQETPGPRAGPAGGDPSAHCEPKPPRRGTRRSTLPWPSSADVCRGRKDCLGPTTILWMPEEPVVRVATNSPDCHGHVVAPPGPQRHHPRDADANWTAPSGPSPWTTRFGSWS